MFVRKHYLLIAYFEVKVYTVELNVNASRRFSEAHKSMVSMGSPLFYPLKGSK